MSNERNVEEFMMSFLESAAPKIDEEYYNIEEQYIKTFGHSIPRAMLPDGISLDDIKKEMQRCLETGEDKLMDNLGVEINNEYMY